jgi:hypothetical protein
MCRYTCRALFEKHKLLFSFQMCIKILEYAGKLNKDECNFLIRGGVVGPTLCLLPSFFLFICPSSIVSITGAWQGSDRIHCACWFLYVSTIL